MQIDTWEECQVTMEAKTGVMHLQAKQQQRLPVTSETKREARQDPPLKP